MGGVLIWEVVVFVYSFMFKDLLVSVIVIGFVLWVFRGLFVFS